MKIKKIIKLFLIFFLSVAFLKSEGQAFAASCSPNTNPNPNTCSSCRVDCGTWSSTCGGSGECSSHTCACSQSNGCWDEGCEATCPSGWSLTCPVGTCNTCTVGCSGCNNPKTCYQTVGSCEQKTCSRCTTDNPPWCQSYSYTGTYPNCDCPSPNNCLTCLGPTATPTNTPTPTPTKIPCNSSCTQDTRCASGACFEGFCRNISCLNESDCNCVNGCGETCDPFFEGTSCVSNLECSDYRCCKNCGGGAYDCSSPCDCISVLTSTPTPTSVPTNTPTNIPTNTPVPTNTLTPIPTPIPTLAVGYVCRYNEQEEAWACESTTVGAEYGTLSACQAVCGRVSPTPTKTPTPTPTTGGGTVTPIPPTSTPTGALGLCQICDLVHRCTPPLNCMTFVDGFDRCARVLTDCPGPTATPLPTVSVRPSTTLTPTPTTPPSSLCNHCVSSSSCGAGYWCDDDCAGGVCVSYAHPSADCEICSPTSGGACEEPSGTTDTSTCSTDYIVSDTYIDHDNPGTNYGSSPVLKVIADVAGTGKSTLLKFDFSSIPQNAVITSATLKLFLSDIQGNGSGYPGVDFKRVTRVWSPNEANWNKPETGASEWYGCDSNCLYDESLRVCLGYDYNGINITDYVKKWVNESESNPNNGLYIGGYTAKAAVIGSLEAVTPTPTPVTPLCRHCPPGCGDGYYCSSDDKCPGVCVSNVNHTADCGKCSSPPPNFKTARPCLELTYIERADDWFQTQDVNVYSRNGIGSKVPAGKYFSEKGAGGNSGVIVYSGASSPNFGQGTISQDGGWLVNESAAFKKISFEYLANRLKINRTVSSFPDGTTGRIFYSADGRSINTGWNLPARTKIVAFVNGNVEINANLVVPKTSFLAIIASGNITFAKNVTKAQGLFFADGQIIINGSEVTGEKVQFQGQGSFVGLEGVVLGRRVNDTLPAETFASRPDFWVNFPEEFAYSQIFREELMP